MPLLRRSAAAATAPAPAPADSAQPQLCKKDADEANATAALLAAGLAASTGQVGATADMRAAVVIRSTSTTTKKAASPPPPSAPASPPSQAQKQLERPSLLASSPSAASSDGDKEDGVLLVDDEDVCAADDLSKLAAPSVQRSLSAVARPDPALLIRPGGLPLSTAHPAVAAWRAFLNPAKQAYLLAVTQRMPTNHLMLTFRTLTRDFGTPHANKDHLAERLRDALMPVRGALHRSRSPLVQLGRFLLEFPALGIPGIVNFVDARTQWFDEQVSKAVADGFSQVVVVAAGYDTRAYRLGKTGVKFFEVDLPHASETKQKLVDALIYGKGEPYNGVGGAGSEFGKDEAAKAARPAFVAADLSRTALIDALLADPAHGFDREQRTLFITEGLTYYLPPEAVASLLSSVAAAAPKGSRFAFDFMERSCAEGHGWRPGYDTLALAVWNKGEPFRSALDERPEALRALLSSFGFRLTSLLGGKDLRDAYLPTLTWLPFAPAISPYFRYLSCEKV
jgi:O-methyltransferase involved in polyketide biosynthesis